MTYIVIDVNKNWQCFAKAKISWGHRYALWLSTKGTYGILGDMQFYLELFIFVHVFRVWLIYGDLFTCTFIDRFVICPCNLSAFAVWEVSSQVKLPFYSMICRVSLTHYHYSTLLVVVALSQILKSEERQFCRKGEEDWPDWQSMPVNRHVVTFLRHLSRKIEELQ